MGFLDHLAVVCSEAENQRHRKEKMEANAGYFDVRDHNDAWIRVWLKKGAMIVLPTGIYHRFTLDSDYYIKVMRLFVGDPVWSLFNRPHDHLPSRKEYLETFGHKKFSDQAVDAAA